MHQHTTIMILISIFANAVLATGAAAALVQGAPGMHPSEICRSNGLLDAIGTSLNLDTMRELLHLSGVERAYVGGFNNECGDFVVHVMGAVAEHNPLTNPASHAFCVRPNAVPLDECVKLERFPNHPNILAKAEATEATPGERLAAPLTAEKLEPIVEALRKIIPRRNLRQSMRCRLKGDEHLDKLRRLAAGDGAMRCRRKRVVEQAPAAAPMRCRLKETVQTPLAPLTGNMRCRRRVAPFPIDGLTAIPTDGALGLTTLKERLNQLATDYAPKEDWVRDLEGLIARRSQQTATPCSIQAAAPAERFAAAKRVTADALSPPSFYDIIALRTLLNSPDGFDLDEVMNLENTRPNVSRVLL